jgi:hypothetical protein
MEAGIISHSYTMIQNLLHDVMGHFSVRAVSSATDSVRRALKILLTVTRTQEFSDNGTLGREVSARSVT